MVRVVDDSAYRNSDAHHSKMIQMVKFASTLIQDWVQSAWTIE